MKALQCTLIAGFAIAVLGLARPLRAGPPPEQVENQAPPQEGAEAPSSQALETPAPPAIAPGTVITKSNWMQYKQFFSDGEIGLWEGQMVLEDAR